MAYEVVFSASGQRDRDRVVDYLVNDLKSPQAAAHFLDELDGVLGLLEKTPDVFPVSKELRLHRMGYRKALFMNYVAMFRMEGETVLIARIFHQSQDYARLL